MSEQRPSGPFFVVGSARSGTTMFRLMLNAHSRLHVPRESWFIKDLMDELPMSRALSEHEVERALTIVTNHPRWRDFQIAETDARTAVGALRAPWLREVVDAIYRGASNKPRWGDKTPGYVTEITRLADLFPTAQFIHVIRDCRDVCNSLHQLRWHGSRLITIARFWRESVSAGRMQGRRLAAWRYLELRYEDLVLKTEAALAVVMAFLGESYEQGMLSFYRDAKLNIAPGAGDFHAKTMREPRTSDVERWKTELAPFQVALIETVAGDVMDSVGQQRRFRGVARLATLGLAGAFSFAEWSSPLRQRLGIRLPLTVHKRL